MPRKLRRPNLKYSDAKLMWQLIWVERHTRLQERSVFEPHWASHLKRNELFDYKVQAFLFTSYMAQ